MHTGKKLGTLFTDYDFSVHQKFHEKHACFICRSKVRFNSMLELSTLNYSKEVTIMQSVRINLQQATQKNYMPLNFKMSTIFP